MIPIPGLLIALITFPGVIVHEFAHQFFCRLFNVAVFEVCYFQTKNPVGYVVHEIPRKKWQSVLISVGPFLVNTVVGAVLALPAAIPILKFHEGGLFDYVLIYLGVSIAMHAFPSTVDAQSMKSAVFSDDSPLWLKFISAPLIGLIYLGAIGSFFWLDFAYGLFVAFGLPQIIGWAGAQF